MLSWEVVMRNNVLRVRVGHRGNRHLDRALNVLKNLDARIPQIRKSKPPHRPQEKRLLDSVCHSNVLGLTCGECGARLRPRNPMDVRTPTHHGYTLDRQRLRLFGGMRKARNHPHGIRDVGSRLAHTSHQTLYPFAKGSHPIGLIIVKLLKKDISRKWSVPACVHAKFIDRLFH